MNTDEDVRLADTGQLFSIGHRGEINDLEFHHVALATNGVEDGVFVGQDATDVFLHSR